MILKKWLINARYRALMQSMMPAVLAVALAWGNTGFNALNAVLAVFGVACAHLAMNLADDYFDYKVDMRGDRDRIVRQGFRAMTVKYSYLVDGSETLKSTGIAIAVLTGVAVLCGGVIVLNLWPTHAIWGPDGLWWIGAIVIACAFMGAFYSAPPLKLAYRGLGEPVIGIIFGPLLMMGVYYASCGAMNWDVVIVSIPVGMLVLNILFVHSIMDYDGDAASNKMTLARLIGNRKANFVALAIFTFLPFVIVSVLAAVGVLPLAYLAVNVALPRAVWLYKSVVTYRSDEQTPRPPVWMGKIVKWDQFCERKVEWFMARWLGARNLLSGFCLMVLLCSIFLKLFI